MKETYSELRKTYSHILAPDCKIRCGTGWFDIIKDLLSSIDLLRPDDPASSDQDIKILKIEKKYGVLMIDWQGKSEIIKSLVDFSEKLSYNTCEICGTAGQLYCGSKWLHWSEYRTLCKDHAIKYYYYEIIHPKGKK